MARSIALTDDFADTCALPTPAARGRTIFDRIMNWLSKSQQQDIVNKIQKVMVDEVPLIPTTEGVNWYQYDTSKIGGWVTQQNPYAQASPYSFPDNAVLLTHLYPTG